MLLTACDILDDKVYDGHGHHHVDDFKVHPANSVVVFVVPKNSSTEILSLDAAEWTVFGDSEWVSSKCDSFISTYICSDLCGCQLISVHTLIIQHNLTLIWPGSVPPDSYTPHLTA